MRRPSTRWVRAAISNPSAVSPQSHAIVVPRDNPAKASWNTSQPAATTPTANAAMTHGSVSRQAARETMLATALAPSSHAVASTPDVAAAARWTTRSSAGTPQASAPRHRLPAAPRRARPEGVARRRTSVQMTSRAMTASGAKTMAGDALVIHP